MVDPRDDVRTRQGEDVVVALQGQRVLREALAAEVRLLERVLLNHGAGRAVEDEDPLLEQAVQRGPGVDVHPGGRLAPLVTLVRFARKDHTGHSRPGEDHSP